jgi:hypothetical protein
VIAKADRLAWPVGIVQDAPLRRRPDRLIHVPQIGPKGRKGAILGQGVGGEKERIACDQQNDNPGRGLEMTELSSPGRLPVCLDLGVCRNARLLSFP